LPVTCGLTSDANPPGLDYYSYIAQTIFTPSITGIYSFEANNAADNYIEVFLGGAVSDPAGLKPDITGVEKLLSLADENGPGLFLTTVSRTASGIALTVGQQYFLNYVIRDNATKQGTTDSFGSTGFIVGTTAFTLQDPPPPPVPGPLPVLGVGAFLHQARRLRRRIAGRR
jgi:hypothetical protein